MACPCRKHSSSTRGCRGLKAAPSRSSTSSRHTITPLPSRAITDIASHRAQVDRVRYSSHHGEYRLCGCWCRYVSRLIFKNSTLGHTADVHCRRKAGMASLQRSSSTAPSLIPRLLFSNKSHPWAVYGPTVAYTRASKATISWEPLSTPTSP